MCKACSYALMKRSTRLSKCRHKLINASGHELENGIVEIVKHCTFTQWKFTVKAQFL